jgi:hypothetical protein
LHGYFLHLCGWYGVLLAGVVAREVGPLMQLCDTGRDIALSIRSVFGPDLGPDRSDEYLNALIDAGAAQLIETYPVAAPVVQEPIEHESLFRAKGFWPVVVVSFAAICSVVTLLLARLWQ